MTEQEIRARLDLMDALIASMHNQINDLAAIEEAAVNAQQPLPYSNPGLTASKDRLTKSAGQLIEAMQTLRQKLSAGSAAGVST